MAVPILWRNRKQRYSLEGEVCPACERAVFPPRQVCPYCSRAARSQEAAAQLQQLELRHLMALPHLHVQPEQADDSCGQGSCKFESHDEGSDYSDADTESHHVGDHHATHRESQAAELVFMLPKSLADYRRARETGDD
ncbi:MAG: zinc ribbon domain-containing protein [Litorilinea sp.]